MLSESVLQLQCDCDAITEIIEGAVEVPTFQIGQKDAFLLFPGPLRCHSEI